MPPSATESGKALPCPVEMAGKSRKPVPWSTFFITSAFLPVWSVTVLPLSITYQLGRAAWRTVSSPKEEKPNFDSGYLVQDSQIIPRKERKYDIIVLGATGFTGKLAVRYLAKTYGVGGKVRWAVAGRSAQKLELVKKELSEELQMDELLKLDTIIVDTSVPATLPRLVEQTRVVATTAGPFALYGSPVVEFCAKFGTHYVDITGETDWVKAMVVQWQETAQKTGAKLVSLCGQDSVPWDLTVMKLQETLKKECNDDLATVSCWDDVIASAPGGTFATVLNALSGKGTKAPAGDFDAFLRLPDGSKSEYALKADLPAMIAPLRSPFVKEGTSHPWTMPFIMAGVNANVVGWSHALRSTGSRTLVYKEYFTHPDFKSAFTAYATLIIGASMMFNPLTLPLLVRFAFSKPGEGPSLSKMEKKFHLCIKAEGVGVNGNRAEAIFYFDKDPACLETSRMLVESGLCLALDEDKLPVTSGGFWTPATAMGNVLLDRIFAVGSGASFTSRIVPKQ
jgi:short subunit dehydrogenase-like uncharacterized protein